MAIDKSWFVLPGKLRPLQMRGAEVRYSEALAAKLILAFTKKGDRILDPFAGFGTTLLAAQKLGRVGYGVEFERARYEYVRNELKSPSTIVHGTSLEISKYAFPNCDFSLTSPPYMRAFDREDPFSNYSRRGSYPQYLRDLKSIYKQVKRLMKRNAVVVVEVSNTFAKGRPMTPLAWDVAKELSKIFYLEREIIHCMSDSGAGPDHSYLLVFRNR